jgi:hypothetical protein
MLLIALGHKAKQGKDEVASYLRNTYSKVFKLEIHSFATAIRQELHDEALRLWRKKTSTSMSPSSDTKLYGLSALGIGSRLTKTRLSTSLTRGVNNADSSRFTLGCGAMKMKTIG